MPSGVSINNITQNSATVSWSEVPNATYDVRYRETGTTSWNTTAVSETNFLITGLAADTEYQVHRVFV